MSGRPVILADEVAKRFDLHHNRPTSLKESVLRRLHRRPRGEVEEFWALREITMHIGRGEAVGLIGRNGSGKSTFLKLVAGIHRPTAGRLAIVRNARIGTMIELGVGFHGELSGEENVALNAAIHGLSSAELEAIYDRIVEFSGLRNFMDVPLKNFSSGMHMRLGFAIAANLDPDIMLLDEIFAVGDEDFQRQCMATMNRFRDAGKTILFVSHAPAAVRAICERVCLLDQGRLLFDGDVEHGLHEYRRLLDASEGQAVRAGADPAPAIVETEEDLDRSWHRLAVGGSWREAGQWQFDFLRRQGLRPEQFVLDVGCGSLAGARLLLPFMDQSHYWGVEPRADLFEAGVRVELARAGVKAERGHFVINDRFDLGEIPYRFDMAIANSLFARLPLHDLARCVAGVVRILQPGAPFFATWHEPQAGADWTAAVPFEYPLPVVTAVCEAAGARVERLPEAGHPRGEQVLALYRHQ